ncbi:unnamed protein product [Rotaria sp. Silwood1]|nr:unnamed protein product [Rotaria sp. Silwood1]CAF1302147.1 unnamed protein product [Rotaria sp. Silwood1]CAF3498970.1 unnamed protein product [Rotaria sp. Silwood1]CAF3523362.1 unnamed protein product [Rotaria sp. Silwood1]CAF3549442.1 unnamed protein product [Rotaria sp. Silwood1]
MDILGFATKLNAGKHHSINNDDVFIDRLNHRYTVTMILVFAAIVTTQQYFGSPITCWVPAQFTGGYEKYANDICWIMNTYYVPMDHDIPHAETTRYERMLKYYQWSPFILLFMALCFYFPRMLWRSLNNKSGLDIDKLVAAALKQEQQADQIEERKKTIEYISNSIRVYIENRYTNSKTSDYHPKNFLQKFFYSLTFWRHRHLSSFIVLLFTFVKFLFLFNSLVQIFLLNSFLGNDYHLFGFEVITKFIRGLDWGESKRFPRVTLCDFHIREIGIIHRYTVQCVLPINLFNEKIFLILWFWILLLAAFNIVDFISWLLRIIRIDSRTVYVRRKLAMNRALINEPIDEYMNSEQMKLNEKIRSKAFVRDYLQEDGCFALRLLARNGQDIIVGEIVDNLYKHFCIIYEREHINSDQEMIIRKSNQHHLSISPVLPRPRQFDALNHDDDHRHLVSETNT